MQLEIGSKMKMLRAITLILFSVLVLASFASAQDLSDSDCDEEKQQACQITFSEELNSVEDFEETACEQQERVVQEYLYCLSQACFQFREACVNFKKDKAAASSCPNVEWLFCSYPEAVFAIWGGLALLSILVYGIAILRINAKYYDVLTFRRIMKGMLISIFLPIIGTFAYIIFLCRLAEETKKKQRNKNRGVANEINYT